MRNHKRTTLSVLFTLVMVVAATTATLNRASQEPLTAEEQHAQQRHKEKPEFEEQSPVVDFGKPEPADPKIRAKRHARSKKYDGSTMEVHPEDRNNSTVRTHSDLDALPPLPMAQSDAVIIGEVLNAKAYLSNDKTGVYSEFEIQTKDILKNAAQNLLTQGYSITALREGGRVRFPSGRVHLYFTSGVRMPRVGRQYVFFLRHTEEDDVFDLLTGYELRQGKAVPLDELNQFKRFKGMDETAFLIEIRSAIANTR